MDSMGQLIDALRESGVRTLWLGLACRHTDPKEMVQFLTLPIVAENVLVLSEAIAAEIRSYLVGVSMEALFERTLREGHELFQAMYQLVKDKGIPEKSRFCRTQAATPQFVEWQASPHRKFVTSTLGELHFSQFFERRQRSPGHLTSLQPYPDLL